MNRMKMGKIGNHWGSTTLTLLNVLGVLGVLNVLYVLHVLMDASLACWALFQRSRPTLLFQPTCSQRALSMSTRISKPRSNVFRAFPPAPPDQPSPMTRFDVKWC